MDIGKHLKNQMLPAGYTPAVELVIELLLKYGWEVGDDLVDIPPGLPRIESGLPTDAGGQSIRVIDLVRALNLLPLLPDHISWVGRHPSWDNR